MPKLSPDAQAVLDAVVFSKPGLYSGIAAGLRAAADQVVQHMHAPDWSSSTYEVAAKEMYLQNQSIRSRLLAIAAELEDLGE